MKINKEKVKEKIAGFIFDLIIESGSKSKFFRKYTNHRFRKQYERVVDSCNYYWISRRNYDLEKANGRLHKEIDDLHCRLRFIYEKVKVVATEYPKNISCPHGEMDEEIHCPVKTDSTDCWCCPGFVCRIPENGTIICWNKNFEQSEDLDKEK